MPVECYAAVDPPVRSWFAVITVSLLSVPVVLASAASADQVLLRASSESFYAGSGTNKLLIHLANDSRRQGLQFDLTYDPAVAELVDVQGGSRVHDPLRVFHSTSPPGVLHVVVYDHSGRRTPLEVGADPIVCVTFAIPADVPADTLRIGTGEALVASDALAPIPIAPQAISVPIFRLNPGLGESGQRVPARFALHQNTPNPFTASTLIPFDVPHQGHVRLSVYDVAGHLVRVLRDGDLSPGRYSGAWDGHGAHGGPVANGIYFYVAQMGQHRIACKMVRSQ